MTSYLLDAVLLGALILSSYRLAIIHRDIKRFRRHQNGYERALNKTSEALVDVGRAIQAINAEGVAMVKTLSIRIDEARELHISLEKRLAERADRASDGDSKVGFADTQDGQFQAVLKIRGRDETRVGERL
jgi:hypothetical protein